MWYAGAPCTSSVPTEEFTAQCHPAATAYPDHGMILPDLFLSGIPKDNAGHQKALFSLLPCFVVSSRLLPFPQFSLGSFFHQFGVTIAAHSQGFLHARLGVSNTQDTRGT